MESNHQAHMFSLGQRKKNLRCISCRNIEPVIEDVFQQAEIAMADTFAGITIAQVAQQVMEAESKQVFSLDIRHHCPARFSRHELDLSAIRSSKTGDILV
jgi:DNA-binding IscR family transcriptional regulator